LQDTSAAKIDNSVAWAAEQTEPGEALLACPDVQNFVSGGKKLIGGSLALVSTAA